MCCSCHTDKEDWNHVLTYGWLDATVVHDALWGKVEKDMGPWKMPPDFWTVLEKGIHYYTMDPGQNSKVHVSSFTGTFNTPRNVVQQAFREQYEIGWSNLLKVIITTQWKLYTEQHLRGGVHQTTNRGMGSEINQCNVGSYTTHVPLLQQRCAQ
jgi:hypothetical protein